ncbi:MAG: PKD domain-containing protein [Ferruginibacter sp.]
MKSRIVAKASCMCLLLASIFSHAAYAQVKASFTASSISGCAPLLVQFTDQSTGNPTKWQWTLGSVTSYIQNPSRLFFNPGVYTVKLVISNATSTDSLIKTQYINVTASPIVNFFSTDTAGCYPFFASFKDQSSAETGNINKWEWDFGDGFASNTQNPTHIYSDAGNYNVTLRATNSAGCISTVSKTPYIVVSAGTHANFTNSNPTSCTLPVTINFRDSSSGSGALKYLWDFGDGKTDTVQNPSHSYTALGNYSVKLIVANSNGCADSITKLNDINIGSIAASFTSPDTACVNTLLALSNTSSGSSSLWNFGDGTTYTTASPAKIYSTSGAYNIKLKVTLGTCSDSTTKKIVILDNPIAAFKGAGLISCQIPSNIDFTNQSQNATSYIWNFGDGSTSINPSPSYLYTGSGNYNVQLIAINSFGCNDTITKTNFVKIQPPTITFNNLPDSGCSPLVKTFSATVSSIDSIVSYHWDFGDGVTSDSISPSHMFNIGNYPISLHITTAGGCSATAIVHNGISVASIPNADFIATPTNACAKTKINFTDLTSGKVSKWLWDFGDGITSTDQNPIHFYGDTGHFDVQLIVWNGGCPDTIIKKKYMHIVPPVANYDIGFQCNTPLIKTFTDRSIGADHYNWDFGDGTIDTVPSPVHNYAESGTYSVTLTVLNNLTGCNSILTQTVKVILVTADFKASDTLICKNTSVNFTASVNNPAIINSYNWNFGDNVISTTTTPIVSHSYKASGTYTVRLITTDILGCKDTVTKNLYMTVMGPTAKFISGVPGSCVNYIVQFTDESVNDGVNPIKKWIWNFGDGKADTLNNATSQHTYTQAGKFTVSLTVIDSSGCSDTYTNPTPLVIDLAKAVFTTHDTASCPSHPVQFNNSSTGINLSYLWNFGDGDTSSMKNPVHSFLNNGIFNVKLSITSLYGCLDSITKNSYVKIVAPIANFVITDSISPCPPLLESFNNQSYGSVSQHWDFGDGTSSNTFNPTHFYTYPGTYVAQLTITGAGGCNDVKQRKIIIKGPTGTFTYNPLGGCVPLTVNFKANAKSAVYYIWDYRDGNTLTTDSSFSSHTYQSTSSYIPMLLLTDSAGCQVPIRGINTISVNNINANFSFSKRLVCDSGEVLFEDSSVSSEQISNYNWNFGNGDTSTLKNPQYQYHKGGIYYPQLIVASQSGCIDTFVSPNPIKIVSSPRVGILNTSDSCIPHRTIFNGKIITADTSALYWHWNFGNGDTSVLQNPPQQIYSIAGRYKTSLKVLNSSGCIDSMERIIEAFPIPNITISKDTFICRGSSITLTPRGADYYQWIYFSRLSCLSCDSTVASPLSDTKYIVKGSTIHGCSAIDSITIRVQQPFAMTYGRPASFCKGNSAYLYANGADSYIWTPSEGLDNPTSASPMATPDITTIYQVVGTDSKACFKDTGLVTVVVHQLPTVSAGKCKTINVGETTDLIPTVSNDVTQITWFPTGNATSTSNIGIAVNPIQTTNYTVHVTNAAGCEAQDTVTVFVICDGANVFIPNTFSPNEDGVNDHFYPEGNGLFKIKTLRIYNRWGQVVYERNNFLPNDESQGWDGTFKGVKLNSDVFVYTIDIICNNNNI